MEKVLSNPLDGRKRASYAEKNAIGLIYQAYSQSVIQAVSQSLSYTGNSLKVEDTVHLSFVFGYLSPILL